MYIDHTVVVGVGTAMYTDSREFYGLYYPQAYVACHLFE